jgi:hypothetical protein
MMLCALPILGKSQFIQFSFFVDTEVTIDVVQELDFGEIIRNSVNEIPISGTRSGWFQIAVLNAANFELDVQAPQYMELVDEETCETDDCRFIVEIGLAYFITNSPSEFRREVLSPLRSGINFIEMPNLPGIGRNQTADYVYVNINVFGRAIVGDVRSGTYTGDLRLGVVY